MSPLSNVVHVVSQPTFENLPGALGIGTSAPRVSWKAWAEPGWTQSGYELKITRGDTESIYEVESRDSVLVPWPAPPLQSRERATVEVRLTGAGGERSDWSSAGVVETGLLNSKDWEACAISPSWEEDADEVLRRPPLVRKSFELRGDIAYARLYVTAHGLYEVEINGSRVGADALSPGWTSYSTRLRYYTYDVTEHLIDGDNALGAWLGDGWWRGRLGFHGGETNLYGSDIALIAQLEITFTDGRTHTVATDGTWRAEASPILTSGLYDGETFDSALFDADWSRADFDDSEWSSVVAVPFDPRVLVAPEGPPVRCTESLTPVSVVRTEFGSLLVDFGQNFAGRIHLRGSGGAGPEIEIRHAEVLQEGRLYPRTLRDAPSVDRFKSVDRDIDWEPRFTIHGFRYAEILGWTGPVEALTITGRVYHTDFERTGWFSSSNPLLNRLHDNVVWSARSNFVDIPMDCPQRDERLGWTGDIQVFAPTAGYLFDVSGMLSSWMKDVAKEQTEWGTVPWFVPFIPIYSSPWAPLHPGALWGDVTVLTPWALYNTFGDTGVLANQYESARAWVDQVTELAGPSRLWDTGFQLGDWLDPSAPPDNPAGGITDPYLVATAYFALSARRMADTARVLGRSADADHYVGLAEEVRVAFLREWQTAPGMLSNDSQTAYALAIAFELFEPDDLPEAGRRLASLVEAGGNRIGTGFAGVNIITDGLSLGGQLAQAYALLLEEKGPSWLSMVRRGATTMWERWDSMLEDGTVNPGDMTSFNHYALGSVADWMHRVVGGLDPIEPGFRRVRFAPRPGGGLQFARTSHESPYGLVRSDWVVSEGVLVLEVELPTGTTGVIELPGESVLEVGPGTHRVSIPWQQELAERAPDSAHV